MTPNQPVTPMVGARSPVGDMPVNGSSMMPPRQGSMPPPQRPAERPEKRGGEDFNDLLSGAGINLDDENRELARADYFPMYNAHDNSFGRSIVNGYRKLSQTPGAGAQTDARPNELTEEEQQRRLEQRADWEASRQSQNPLWDMFLFGGTLNEKIRKISTNEHLVDPQSGVLVNTQRNAPPPIVRVNGLDGSTRVIDRGQAILDTGSKADRLGEIMKLVCLATKTRLTGIMNSAARLSLERRQHSKGRVPMGWEDIAAVHKPATEPEESTAAGTGSNPLKRNPPTPWWCNEKADLRTGTHSQANSDAASLSGHDRVAATFRKMAEAERTAEDARRAKRAKRKAAIEGTTTPITAEQAVEADVQALVEADQKQPKKNKKAQPTTEERHQHANATASHAIAGLTSRFGKKGRTLDWLKPGASGTSTPKALSTTRISAVGTPSSAQTRKEAQEKRFGAWDEDKDPGVQARDVLLVLETDGKAPRAYLRGTNSLET